MASVPRFTFFHALDASWSFVMARQQFGFLRHGQPARDSELGAGESFPSARDCSGRQARLAAEADTYGLRFRLTLLGNNPKR